MWMARMRTEGGGRREAVVLTRDATASVSKLKIKSVIQLPSPVVAESNLGKGKTQATSLLNEIKFTVCTNSS